MPKTAHWTLANPAHLEGFRSNIFTNARRSEMPTSDSVDNLSVGDLVMMAVKLDANDASRELL